ncbi:MAG: Slp family lipoprotein [Methylococcales bacterium]|nr:Slp family lipoprotein [Methylococcales bacterium]
MLKLVLIISAILLNGCSHIPVSIRKAPPVDIQIQDIKKDFSKHKYQTARWGGILIDVENNSNETILQVLAYPLNFYGRPNLNSSALGRFLIRSNDFLDPAIYASNRELTTSGRLVEISNRKVGKKELKLPVIESQQLYLWPQYQRNDCDYPPYGYYGYWGYSYGRPHFRFYGHSRHYY